MENFRTISSVSKPNLENSPSSPSITISKISLGKLPSNPADRKRILEYHHIERDEVRRKYITKGPCQPRRHDFSKTLDGQKFRRFNPDWFDVYGSWLEYTIKKDKAFCLICYLFRDYNKNKCRIMKL